VWAPWPSQTTASGAHSTSAVLIGAARQPLEQALAEYEQRRNEAVRPMYQFTCQLAALEPPPPEMQDLFTALRGNQADTNRFLGTVAGTVPIPEFFAPENTQRILAGG